MALTIFWGVIWVIVAIMGGDFGKTFCRLLTGLAGIVLITIGIIHTLKTIKGWKISHSSL